MIPAAQFSTEGRQRGWDPDHTGTAKELAKCRRWSAGKVTLEDGVTCCRRERRVIGVWRILSASVRFGWSGDSAYGDQRESLATKAWPSVDTAKQSKCWGHWQWWCRDKSCAEHGKGLAEQCPGLQLMDQTLRGDILISSAHWGWKFPFGHLHWNLKTKTWDVLTLLRLGFT